MLRSLAVNQMQRILGFKTGLEDTCITYLKQSQEVLERGGILTERGTGTFVPWFLRKDDQTLSLASGASTIALPEDFIAELEDEHPWLLDDATSSSINRSKLYKGTPDVLDRLHLVYETDNLADVVEGAPKAYQVREEVIKIWPPSDQAYTLYWNYLGTDTALDSDIENGWLKWAPFLLIGHAAENLASDLRDKEGKMQATKLKLEGQNSLLVQHVNRDTTNRRTAMGRSR